MSLNLLSVLIDDALLIIVALLEPRDRFSRFALVSRRALALAFAAPLSHLDMTATKKFVDSYRNCKADVLRVEVTRTWEEWGRHFRRWLDDSFVLSRIRRPSVEEIVYDDRSATAENALNLFELQVLCEVFPNVWSVAAFTLCQSPFPIVRSFGNLRVMEVNFHGIEFPLGAFPLLERLQLHVPSWNDFIAKSLEDELTRLSSPSRLRHLDINFFVDIGPLPMLEDVSLVVRDNDTINALRRTKHDKVRTMYLHTTGAVSVSPVFDGFSNLEELTFRSSSPSDRSIEKVSLPSLKYLNLFTYYYKMNLAPFMELASSLERLVLQDECNDDDSPMMTELFRELASFTCLKSLSLKCYYFHPKDLIEALPSLTALTKLSVASASFSRSALGPRLQSILEAIPNPFQIEELALLVPTLPLVVMNTIAKFQNLKILDATVMLVGELAVLDWWRPLLKLSALRQLSLRRSVIRHKTELQLSFQSLQEIISSCKSLRKVRLHGLFSQDGLSSAQVEGFLVSHGTVVEITNFL